MKNLVCILLVFSFASTSWAQGAETHYNRIHLTANAQQKVENDLVIATLFAQVEGGSASKSARLVNTSIQWGLKLSKKYPSIQIQSGNYTTYPIYKNSKVSGWRVRQTLRLETREMADLSELLGQLQEKLSLQEMHFSISPELKQKTDDKLINDALAAFQRRAQQVSTQLQGRDYNIVNIDIITAGNYAPAPYRSMELATTNLRQSAAPVIASGEQTLRVDINGTIELK